MNTGARANVLGVTFNSETGANAYVSGTIDVQLTSGSFIEGDQYSYITSAVAGGAATIGGIDAGAYVASTSGENTL